MKEEELKELEKKLWECADKMRGAVPVSSYKFIVLGLIFLKYISDSFEEKYKELVAEGYGLLPIDGVRIGTGYIDGLPDRGDPAHIVEKIDSFIRDGVIVSAIRPGSGRQTGQGIQIHDMRGGIRQHMRNPDEGSSLLDGHVLTVDIACPHITDALFALQIIFRDILHRDGGVFKMLDLPLGRISVFKAGIKDHKGQHSDHNEHVD